jgi:hypothetical protein
VRYKVKDGFILRQVAGTWVAAPVGSRALETRAIFTLSDTAVFLWNLLAEGIPYEDIITKTTEDYVIDRLTAEKEFDKFLEFLKANNLLEA